jgi:hypothetical protein
VVDPLTTDGEVGVLQAGIERIDAHGEAVSESEQADGVVTIPQVLGLAVADRDVPVVSGMKSPAHEAENNG